MPINPTLPPDGTSPWGDQMRTAFGEVVDAVNANEAEMTTGRLSPDKLSATIDGRVATLQADGSADESGRINAFLTENAGRGGLLVGDFNIAGTVFWPAGTWDLSRATFRAADGWSGYPFQAECQRVAVMAPRNFTATPSATGGTLAAGKYFYSVTAVTTTGETIGAYVVSADTTGTTGSVALSWLAPHVPAGAGTITGYRVWRGTTGRLNALIATLGATATSFTDTGLAGTAEEIPARNTTFARTAGITIVGGVLDVNGPNRPCDYNWPESGKYAGHGLDFQHVDDLVIDGLTVKNATKWAIAIADFGNIRTDNLIFDTDSDGIHVVGPGKAWTSSHVRAYRSGDDVYGVSLAEWPGYAVSRGSIESVEFTDLWSVNGHSFVRVLGCADHKIGRLKIDGISGEYSGQFRGGVYVWDDQNPASWPDGTDIDMVEIRNVHAEMTGTPAAPSPYSTGNNPVVVLSGARIGRATVSDVWGSALSGTFRALVEVGTAGYPQTIDQLRIERVECLDNCSVGVVAVRANTAVGSMVVADARVTADGDTALVRLLSNTITIGDFLLERPSMVTTATSVLRTDAGIGRLTVRDVSDFNSFRVVLLEAGGNTAVFVAENVRSTTANEVVRVIQTNPVEVHLRSLELPSLPSSVVSAQPGSKVTVLSAGGISTPAARAIVGGSGTSSLRVSGMDARFPLGTLTLTPRDGDMLYNMNTDTAIAGGRGLCICDTSGVWHNLHTGGEWPNA